MSGRILTNEEIRTLAEQVEAEFPEIERDLQALEAAAAGDSLSASVRRSIGSSIVPLATIAIAAGLSNQGLSQFLRGEREVTNRQLDSMVQALGLRPELVSY